MEYMFIHYPPHYGTFGLGFSHLHLHLHLHIHMFSDVFIVVRLIVLMNIELIKF